MRVTPLFATPIYVVPVPDAGRLTIALRDVITVRRESAGGIDRSNVGGWQSDIDMLRWGGPAAGELARVVTEACQRLTTDENGNLSQVQWQPEMWANVNRAGDSNQNHWHPGSYLSFVFYAEDGYAGSTDKALGGELVFLDPRMPFLRMRTPHLRHLGSSGKAEEQETWVRPYGGLLIGFPSFLGHSVRPYRGAGDRISVAINMVARPGA